MDHSHRLELPMSPTLANSYGLEIATSEQGGSPPPQVRYDAGASGPQVLEGQQHRYQDLNGQQFAHTNDPPVDHYAQSTPQGKPADVYTGYIAAAQSPSLSNFEPKHHKPKILGLPRALFWVLVGLVTLIILGTALGAGLGVGLSNRNTPSPPASSPTDPADPLSQSTSMPITPTPTVSSSTSASSSTTTTTSSAPVTSGTVGLADNSCTFSTPHTYHAPDNTAFTEYCFTDWPNGAPAADGQKVTDLTYTTVYTFEDCMQKCLDYNKRKPKTKCTAVTYNSNLTDIIAVGHQGGNCFLKDRKGLNIQGSAESACAAIAL